MTFDTAEGPSVRSVGWKDDAEDVLLVELGDINVNMTIDGSAKTLFKIDLTDSHIYITNVTLVLELSTSTTD